MISFFYAANILNLAANKEFLLFFLETFTLNIEIKKKESTYLIKSFSLGIITGASSRNATQEDKKNKAKWRKNILSF
jgi:hypothetical protein